jgi:5-formyltetrahydrofolate cyclo-ligase
MRLDQQKRDLRSSFRHMADLFQAHQASHQVERLNENLIGFLQQQTGTWAAFKGCEHEPRLDKVIQTSSHLNWIFPRMEGDDIVFLSAKKFAAGKYGIEEPVGGGRVPLEDIQGFLIPGLAFDKTGTRLGRGKGYYDRLLARSSGVRVGIGFGFQLSEARLPADSKDEKMDFLISEQGFFTCNNKIVTAKRREKEKWKS